MSKTTINIIYILFLYKLYCHTNICIMNNIDNNVLNKLVPRIFKIINNMPENMDANIINNIFDENEKLKINNNKLLTKLKDLQKRKDNNEHKMINVYHNLKKKIDKLQNENF